MKKEKKQSTAESSTISTLLGRDTEIEGTLRFKETIRVDGKVKGKLISSDGTLIVGEHARLDAEISVGVAIVRGNVTGKVEAAQRIEVYSPAQIAGDISAPSVAIDSGVVFNGNCTMQSGKAQIAKVAQKPAGGAAEGDAGDQKVAKNL